MAQNISFKVKVNITNPGALPELQYRIDHFIPAYEAIFSQWAKINKQKFEQSEGMEQSGAEVFDEEWAPVTEAYFKSKHGEGTAKVTKKAKKGGKARHEDVYPNWLLVRTGALREAMINPDALFSEFSDDQAIFGTPTDSELASIVAWQAGDRQKHRDVIFLSQPDMNMIKQIVQDYLSMGGNFAQLRSDAALAAIGYAPIDALGMEIGFDGGNMPGQAVDW